MCLCGLFLYFLFGLFYSDYRCIHIENFYFLARTAIKTHFTFDTNSYQGYKFHLLNGFISREGFYGYATVRFMCVIRTVQHKCWFFFPLSSEIVLFSCFSFVLVMYQWKLFDAHKQLIKATLVFMPAFFAIYRSFSLGFFFYLFSQSPGTFNKDCY